MDLNFIIFFIFLIIVIYLIEITDITYLLLVYALMFAGIFANTQSATPLFFSNTDYLGWGRFFNVFWLMLTVICMVKSFYTYKHLVKE